MQVGVTGSRDGINGLQDFALTIWTADNEAVKVFRHGDCIGADVEVAAFMRAAYPKCKIACHPPENSILRGYFKSDKTFPTKSYFARNRDIVDNSEILLGFPSHRSRGKGGTWYTINYAVRTDVPVVIFHADGEVEYIS